MSVDRLSTYALHSNVESNVIQLLQLFGHLRIHYDKMPQFLKFQESSKTVDEMLKAKVLDNYSKTLEHYEQKCIQCMKGVVWRICVEDKIEEKSDRYFENISINTPVDIDPDGPG